MKKFLSLAAILLMTSLVAMAQKDVTTFLGISVDGFKSDMIKALKAKGFVPSELLENTLEGEFNGYDVQIRVVTNNNKVYRIVVIDKNFVDETAIRIRFNNLCRQFENNPRYISLDDFTIPEDEDISYEMLINKKRYEADFLQEPKYSQTQDTIQSQSPKDASQLMQELIDLLEQKFTQEQLANPTKKEQEEINQIRQSFALKLSETVEISNDYIDSAMNKSVWFMINEQYGTYRIVMYYDNGYNQANGEDL